MSMQQVVQPRPSANGFGRRRVERETGSRLESKFLSGKPNISSVNNPGSHAGSKVGGDECALRDRLIYLTACLIGQYVEVQVKNGSIFSGIFHASNPEKDFGIVLKMARLAKDGFSKGHKLAFDSSSKAPSRMMVIPAKELVQVIAKGVSVTGNELTDGVQSEKRQDIMIDSYISHTSFVDVERELERWTPDEDDPECPELENIFDGTWNRKWDQFETNAALFGVKSTFDEELYTTKLEKGPQMRELEKEALRIAREIEGEDTEDLHLAEERGLQLHGDVDMDEESRFSSVFRVIDDSEYRENEDSTLDTHNTETFGGSSDSFIARPSYNVPRGRNDDAIQASSSFSSMVAHKSSSSSLSLDGAQPSHRSVGGDLFRSVSNDHATQLDAESRMNENQFKEQHGGRNYAKDLAERKTVSEEAETLEFEDFQPPLNGKKVSSDRVGLSPSATAYAPSSVSSTMGELDGARPGKVHGVTQPGNPSGRHGGSASRSSDRAGGASLSSGPGLSPSSSVGSLSSEKSTLNPYAKEFKLNPNAKSFTPYQTPLRPSSPVSDGSYYFPANVSGVPHMPVGMGIGPSFGGPQPVLYNPQSASIQSPQTYIHPNGPMYGPQMILGHPRQVVYMPGYPPDMEYKGRDF